MTTLATFIEILCGTFDNSAQCCEEERLGTPIHPKSKHVIGICNDRISNLPDDFKGYFVIEESYFQMSEGLIEKHYLFLYEENEEGDIRLSSYNIPAHIPKELFTNANLQLQFDYDELEVSPRFEPLVLKQRDGEYFGENVSRFAAETLFEFSLRVLPGTLVVKELLLRDGERIAGYEQPTIYQKMM